MVGRDPPSQIRIEKNEIGRGSRGQTPDGKTKDAGGVHSQAPEQFDEAEVAVVVELE